MAYLTSDGLINVIVTLQSFSVLVRLLRCCRVIGLGEVDCGDSVAQHCSGKVSLRLLILESASIRSVIVLMVCDDDAEQPAVLCVVLMILLECAVQILHLSQLVILAWSRTQANHVNFSDAADGI